MLVYERCLHLLEGIIINLLTILADAAHQDEVIVELLFAAEGLDGVEIEDPVEVHDPPVERGLVNLDGAFIRYGVQGPLVPHRSCKVGDKLFEPLSQPFLLLL